MRLHRFFVDKPLEVGETSIHDEELAHQLRDVFRAVTGYRLILLDNSGLEFEAAVSKIFGSETILHILSKKDCPVEPKKLLTLFVALPKKDLFEWILEKGTEIGVTSFVPVITERTEKTKIRFDRAQKIIKEASEQCGRGKMPNVSEPIFFKEMLDFPLSKITFNMNGETLWNPDAQSYKLGVCIGPEGGWTDRELKSFKDYDIPILSLGNSVLRTETAAIASASLLLLG